MFININILDHMFHNCFNLKLEKKTPQKLEMKYD